MVEKLRGIRGVVWVTDEELEDLRKDIQKFILLYQIDNSTTASPLTRLGFHLLKESGYLSEYFKEAKS